ncbi:MAG TPA: hypothetical protein VIJ14_09965, partial [Rhabdochlamydiaceae bacterium]
TQSLVAQKVSKVEINQWIDLLSKLLSYEDRGRAKVHLESPLFKSEARVRLVYDIACKCKVFIHRAGFLSLDTVPRIQDIPLMDVSIDLKVHKDHRCVHIPLDPNDKYFVFMDNGRTQMVAPFSLKGTDRLNIAQMQRVLDESSNGELESPTKKGKTEKIPEEQPVQDEEFRIASRIPAFRAPTF